MKLNSVMIGSADPKRLADYYTKLFGAPRWDENGFTGWELGAAGVMVGPHDQVHGESKEPGRVIWNIESADVRGQFEKLVSSGATVVREPYKPDESGEFWIATFSDPDSNYFQLVSPMEV